MFLSPCSLVSSLVQTESTNTPQTGLDRLYSSQRDGPSQSGSGEAPVLKGMLLSYSKRV